MYAFLPDLNSWIWIGILVVCCLIEALTFGLTTIWAAIASIPLIFLAKTGLPVRWQILIFIVLTAALIVFTRPFAVKKLKIGKNKTNIDSIIGTDVIITKTITEFQKGEAKAKNGVIWAAASENNVKIEEGAVCSVVSIEGNTITVKTKE